MAACDSAAVTIDFRSNIFCSDGKFRNIIFDVTEKKWLTHSDATADGNPLQISLLAFSDHGSCYSPKEVSKASTNFSMVTAASSPLVEMVIFEFFFTASIKMLRMLLALMVMLL